METIKRLPKRYNPSKVEKEIKEFWNEHKSKEKVVEKTSDKEPYYFLDGPPYASGKIHLGTAWNKILKDVAIRFYTSKGRNIRRQPGWDMHGLPIEVKTEEKLDLNIKQEIQEFGVKKFIDECKELALENKEIMEQQMKNLAVWMDWDDPYLTIKNEWIESEWSVLEEAWEKELLYKDVKVMHWCKRCQTALAEHEVEYEEIRDPSIYVKLPLVKREDEYVLVWTTTPWTLPANMAVMLHPDYTYVKVKVGGMFWWIAKRRLDPVMNAIGINDYTIIEKKKGKKLQGLKYIHPFFAEYEKQKEFDEKEKVHTLVIGEEVTLTEGTGCVHIAPGHGKEDLEMGKEYGLPVYSPVDSEGKFTEGTWENIDIKEADPKIIDYLREKDNLVGSGDITHRYPICWRCKSPLIFRTTEQWFLAVEELREDLIEKNLSRVEWIPEWTRDRFLDGVKKVGDWCISRQRFWNAPIPLWQCEECDHEEMIGRISELRERVTRPIENEIDLHRPFVDEIELECPVCGENMKRIPDVLDVWFDSGVASWASLHYPKRKDLFEKFWPSDLIIEGEDQVLKWFYVQQILGLILFERIPYRRVVMHGFVLDEEGKGMHKSLGNIITPEEIIEEYGVDILRLYLVSATALGSDLKFNYEGVDQIEASLRILWNLFFLVTQYMEIDTFHLSKIEEEKTIDAFTVEDEWILSCTKNLVSEMNQKLEGMKFPAAVRTLLDYCTEDLSRWYGKLVRRRLWIEEEDPSKNAVYLTFYKVFKKFLPLLGFFAPHLAEFLYQNTIRRINDESPESVHLLDFPSSKGRNPELEEHMKIIRTITSAGLAVREQSNIKLRWPLRKAIIETKQEKVKKAVNALESLLTKTLNVKSVEIKEMKRRVKCHPSYASLGPKYKEKADQVAEAIRNANGRKIKHALEDQDSYLLEVNDKEYQITREDVDFESLPPKDYISEEIPGGSIFLLTERGAKLKAEGYVRDLIRRIQEMRKGMGLEMEDQIQVGIQLSSEEEMHKDMIEKQWKNYIKHETRTQMLQFTTLSDPEYSKEWKIAGEDITIDIKTVSK